MIRKQLQTLGIKLGTCDTGSKKLTCVRVQRDVRAKRCATEVLEESAERRAHEPLRATLQ